MFLLRPLHHHHRRRFSSSASLHAILTKRGLSPESATNVAKALAQTTSQLAQQESFAQVLPINALRDLELSWKNQNPDGDTKQKDVQFLVIDPYAGKTMITGKEGQSLMDVSRANPDGVLSDYLEFACGGNMTCSSCHVYVKTGYTPPTEEEQDMLDLAWEPIDGQSRLGCQLHLSQTNRLEIQLPSKAHNLFK